MTTVDIPELALVVLVGVSGSGKSTFARAHFLPTQVLSSDAFRAMVADDENDQSASADAFDALHHVAGQAAARPAGSPWWTPPTCSRTPAPGWSRWPGSTTCCRSRSSSTCRRTVCWERTQARPDRTSAGRCSRRQHRDLRRSIGQLAREGFRKVHVLRGRRGRRRRDRYERLFNDRRELTGPFDIIGDVHGCRAELEPLLRRAGLALIRDDAGRPVDAAHPDGPHRGVRRRPGGPRPGLARRAAAGDGHGRGRHARCACPATTRPSCCARCAGARCRSRHGLAETLAQLDERRRVRRGCRALPRRADQPLRARRRAAGGGARRAEGGVPRPGLRPGARVRHVRRHHRRDRRVRPAGALPVGARLPRRGHGRLRTHARPPTPEWVNNTICLDTGCVFGGQLTALRYPERELVVGAGGEGVLRAGPAARRRAGPTARRARCDLADVTGRRHVEHRLRHASPCPPRTPPPRWR